MELRAAVISFRMISRMVSSDNEVFAESPISKEERILPDCEKVLPLSSLLGTSLQLVIFFCACAGEPLARIARASSSARAESRYVWTCYPKCTVNPLLAHIISQTQLCVSIGVKGVDVNA